MIDEVTFDPVQVHSPGWKRLARSGAAALSGAPRVVIRERPGRLSVHCELDGLDVAQRRACERVITWLQASALRTCQACGTRDASVASPDGRSLLRLCAVCTSRNGRAPAEMPAQWQRAEAAC